MSKLASQMGYTPLLRATIVSAVTGVFLAVTIALWSPAYLQKERHTNDISSLESEIMTLQGRISLAKALQRNRHALSELTDKLGQKTSQAILIEELNKIVLATGVTLTDQAFRETGTIDAYNVYRQTLVLTGNYAMIRHLLSRVASAMPGLNVISRITLNRESEGVITAQIDLDTYSVQIR
jgi:Tfp pilus assembly protein PilO